MSGRIDRWVDREEGMVVDRRVSGWMGRGDG